GVMCDRTGDQSDLLPTSSKGVSWRSPLPSMLASNSTDPESEKQVKEIIVPSGETTSPTYSEDPGPSSFSWADAPGDHVLLEFMAEGLAPNDDASARPTLADIHGFVQQFEDFGGCNFYFHVDTSDVNSGETFTQ